MITLLAEGGGTTDRSGFTGSAEIPDPPARSGPDGLRTAAARLKRLPGGLVRVLTLTFAAGRMLTLGLCAATVLAGLIPAANAYLVRVLIDTVATAVQLHAARRPESVTLPMPLGIHPLVLSPVSAVVVVVAAQFVVFLLSSVANAVSQICTELLQDKLTIHMQLRIMAQASRLDLAFFEDSASYDLLSQASNEAGIRPVTMITAVFGLIQTAIIFLSMIGLLAALSPLLALLAVLAPIPAFLADLKYGTRGFNLAMLTSAARRRMDYLSQLVTRDTYAKEVRLFGLGPFFIERFRLIGGAYYQRQRRQVRGRRLAGPAWGAISILIASVTYGYVGLSAVAGRLSLGDVTLYAAAATTVQASVQTLFQGVSAMYENNLYLDLLYRLLAARPQIQEPPDPVRLSSTVRGHLRFEHVSFRYPGAPTPALDDVSFEIHPGETLALVGPNGAGKSTLVKLMCRLYVPDSGQILLDGVDIASMDPTELRQQIGALFQDHTSYQATAAENIGLGHVARLGDRTAVIQAAQRAGAGEFIDRLPEGYDSPLGKWFDGGTELSGGQWQKIALARAFMRTAPLLVLDEPSSALDARAEYVLFNRLAELAADRTTLYISHRFSTVRRADRIVVLEDGRVIETGAHRDLMALDGVYAELFRLQAEAYLEEQASR